MASTGCWARVGLGSRANKLEGGFHNGACQLMCLFSICLSSLENIYSSLFSFYNQVTLLLLLSFRSSLNNLDINPLLDT